MSRSGGQIGVIRRGDTRRLGLADNMTAHRSLNPAAWPAPVSIVR
jgi:hypothetical protein